MESPDRPAPRLGWRPEWIACAVLVLSLGAAWFQDRDAPLLGPARREAVRSQSSRTAGTIARHVWLAAPATLRDGPGEAFAAVARLDVGVPIYTYGERDGWTRVTSVGKAGELLQGWLREPSGRLRPEPGEPVVPTPGLRRALAAGIERAFLERYPHATVRAVGDDATTLRVTGGQVGPPLADRMGRDFHWESLAGAGFREFELTDGSRTYGWRIPIERPRSTSRPRLP